MNNYHTKHQLNNILETSEGVSYIFKEYVEGQLGIMRKYNKISDKEYIEGMFIIASPELNNATMNHLNQRLRTYDNETGVPML